MDKSRVQLQLISEWSVSFILKFIFLSSCPLGRDFFWPITRITCSDSRWFEWRPIRPSDSWTPKTNQVAGQSVTLFPSHRRFFVNGGRNENYRFMEISGKFWSASCITVHLSKADDGDDAKCPRSVSRSGSEMRSSSREDWSEYVSDRWLIWGTRKTQRISPRRLFSHFWPPANKNLPML